MCEKLSVKTGLNSAQAGEATNSVGRGHSSDEVFIMKMERRASVIQLEVFLNNSDKKE